MRLRAPPAALIAAALAVVLVGWLVATGPVPADLESIATTEIRPDDSSDELWVRALWNDLANDGSRDEAVERLFTAAIDRAEDKAPIYVSLGDSSASPRRLLDDLERMVDSAVLRAESSFAEELGRRLPEIDFDDTEAVLGVAEASLDLALRSIASDEVVRRDLASFVEALTTSDDASLAIYVAGAMEDPNHLTAWERLATRATGEIQRRAIDELLARDSDNALPYYIRAGMDANAGEFDEAVDWIRRGNERPHCRTYPSPRPRDYRLNLSSQGLGRSLPASPEVVDVLLDLDDARWDWWNPSPKVYWRLLGNALDEAEALAERGDHAASDEVSRAVERAGLRLMNVQPRDALYATHGRLRAQMANRMLLESPSIGGRERAELQRRREAIAMFASGLVRELDSLAEERRRGAIRVLVGRWNPVRAEAAAVERQLRAAGLLHAPFQP